jgi:hypothetical protein
MELEDFAEPEVGIGIAVAATVTAAVASPRFRGLLRKGVVYGLAGLLIAKDKVTAAGRGLASSARQAVTPAEGTTAAEASSPAAGTAPAGG